MKKFSDPPIPKEYGIFDIFGYFTIYLIVEPTIPTFALIILLDYLAIIPLLLFHIRIFKYYYPEMIPLFDPNLEENFKKFDEQEKTKILELALEFPAKRAKAASIEGSIKLFLFNIYLMILLWDKNLFFGKLFLCTLSLGILVLIFNHGVYRELNLLVGRKISYWHEKYDFSKAIFNVKKTQATLNYDLFPFNLMWIAGVLALFIYYDWDTNSFSNNSVFLFCVYLSSALWLSQKLRREEKEILNFTLQEIQNGMAKVEMKKNNKPIALHPLP